MVKYKLKCSHIGERKRLSLTNCYFKLIAEVSRESEVLAGETKSLSNAADFKDIFLKIQLSLFTKIF